MLRRLRTLRRNASLFNVILLLLFSLLMAWNGWLALSKPHLRPGVLAMASGLFLTWWVRDWLVDHCQLVLRLLTALWWGLIFLSIFRPPVIRGGLLETLLWGALSLYLGGYFWVLSDERIVKND